MSLTNVCFENVIGLSRTDCQCYGSPPVGYDSSASGVFLDETTGLNIKKVFAAAECSEDGWDILTRAREAGLRRMKSEVVRGVMAVTKAKRPVGRSVIGKEKGTKTVKLESEYHGLDVKFANHVGGRAIIRKIGGAFKFTGTVDVLVYDANDNLLATRTIVATQNKLVWTDIENIEVDLGDFLPENQRLWFLFQPSSGQTALDWKVASCGCSGKPKWNVEYPYYESAVVNDGQNWTAWAMAGGTYGADLSNRENWTHTNETQGLALDIDFQCDGNTVMCSGEPNYEQDEVQMSFAVGVQLFSALDVIAQITNSTRVVREAIAGGDELELTRVALIKDVQQVVEFIVQVLTSDPEEGNPRSGMNLYSDCFTCKDDSHMHARTIQR